MPERPTPPPASEAPRAPLFTAGEIRVAFIATAVGMIGLLVLILLLASSRPQGAVRPADDSQFRALLASSAASMEGYELLEGGRARIDIDRAIELVAERGVDLQLAAIGSAPAAQAGGQAPGAGAEAAAADAGEADGEALYGANCASCHQAQGQGLPGAFPPLANGHMPALVAAEGGRAYVVRAVLFGVQGQIEVEGQNYNGLMPAWAQLADAEIAAVLNHELTAWGNEDALPDGFEPITADEVATARGEELSPTDVLALRPAPDAAPADPAAAAAAETDGDAPTADGDAAENDADEGEADAQDAAADEPADAPAEDGEAPVEDADGEDAPQAADEPDAAAEDDAADEEAADAGAAAAPAVDGEAAYAANCASCHQAQGQGVPGAFPPLADGHMPALLAADGGRDFLLHVLVYGLQGSIEVDGQTYNGLMPAWQQLDDATIAAILNHELTAWGNEEALPDGFEPIAPDEVAAVRGEGLSPADVLELRPVLE